MLSTLQSRIFSSLTSLLKLNLGRNRLNVIEAESFAGLNNLQYLDLSTNKIFKLDPATFSSLTSLKELNLASNSIYSISAELFLPLSNIYKIDLSNNMLEKLSPGTFRGVRMSLGQLSFYSNQLRAIDVPDLYCLNLNSINLCNYPLSLGWSCMGFDTLKAAWEKEAYIKPADCEFSMTSSCESSGAAHSYVIS